MAELNLIDNLSVLLSLHGKTQIVYLTAEFAPYSSQYKPDLIFTREDKVVFIEYKEEKKGFKSRHLKNELVEHRDFVQESIDQEFIYLYSTNSEIDQQLVDELIGTNIKVSGLILNSIDLYNVVINLTNY